MRNLSAPKSKHNYLYLLISILTFAFAAYIFYKFPPTGNLDLGFINIPVLPIFLLLVCGFVFSFVTFFLIRKLQGAIFTVFIMLYIFLRVIGFTHIVFLVVLIALLIGIELVIFNKIKLRR